MKSPFLVAAQMRANMEDKMTMEREESSSSSSSSSSASSSSLSSSTSSLSSFSSLSSTTPSKLHPSPSGSASTATKRKKKQRSKAQLNMPELDLLPGSLLLDSSSPQTTSGLSTPARVHTSSSSSSSSATTAPSSKNTAIIFRTRSRANTRAAREAERSRKAKRWSNGILVTSALPIIAAIVSDYLHPATARLSAEHSRQASWHLSTLASKCLHLSHQVPSGTSAVMNLIHLTTHQPLSTSNTQSTSSILLNALSTAPTTERYFKGFDDIYIVLLWIAIWTFFRESMIRFVCGPIGRYGGIKRTAALQRFGEQGYDVVSHLLAVVFGTCIMQNQESGYRNMNMDGLWKGYPHYQLPASLKFYYLIQMGFWLQQVLTLHLEKRRKDYSQMFLHHIITVSLLYLSYIYNFTYIGNVILVLMDVSDIILGTAKMLKYLKFHENICNIAFGLFMASWIITRHILYPKVLLSVILDSYDILGKFDWKPQEEWYYSENTRNFFVILLSALQVLLILWFFMIVKVAVGVLSGKPAGDLRSDDEEEEESYSEVTVSDSSSSRPASPESSKKWALNRSARLTNGPASLSSDEATSSSTTKITRKNEDSKTLPNGNSTHESGVRKRK